MLNVFVNTLFFGRHPGFNLFNIQRLELKAIKSLTFYLCFYLLFFNYLIFYKIKMLSAETENISFHILPEAKYSFQTFFPQHFLYFFPLPQGHGALG